MVSSVGYVVSEFLISVSLKYLKLFPIKPFSCGYCLSFWFGLIFALLSDLSILDAFGIASLSAVINLFIFKYSK